MTTLRKAKVTLGGVPLAATSTIAWQFVAGVAPFTTVYSVHRSAWESRLKSQLGEPLRLEIVDSRGVRTSVNGVYILHEAPSDSPHRVSFVVADKRWRWPYRIVARDFNMPRKTGDRTGRYIVPIQLRQLVDTYDYLPYSLKPPQDEKWTAKDMVGEVLEILEGEGRESFGYEIESFPIKSTGGSDDGQHSIQGVTLRDPGDVALARALSYVPGADVYIDARGRAVVFDATDLDATERHFQQLPVDTYAGEKATWIDRVKIRPSKVVVHYQREIELLLEYSDDYRNVTSSGLVRSRPYIENVAETVDPLTVVMIPDDSGTPQPVSCAPGTWVPVKYLLEAWDRDRPEGSLPWTFDTIKQLWVKGDLEAALGAGGADSDPYANVAMRAQSLRTHFRQTFRINRHYMQRVRSIRAVRVGLLDPVTGARARAAVWGQACFVPSAKGYRMATRGTTETSKLAVYRNIDYLAPSRTGGVSVIDTAPGPADVAFLDEELGVFRINWLRPPYGEVDSIIPCNLVDEQGNGRVPSRDLSRQDDTPMGPAMKVEAGTNGLWLSPTLQYRVLLTIVPSAPNNETQFHRIEVKADEVAPIFQREFGIANGKGPALEVFVPPGETTARFALFDDVDATATIQDLLGLRDPAGIEGNDLPGYVLCNLQRELTGHAVSLAAEHYVTFADNVQGAVVTRVPDSGAKLVGNMAAATVRVAAAPSGKVDLVSTFPGQQRQVSRLAFMPESTRRLILGVVPFK